MSQVSDNDIHDIVERVVRQILVVTHQFLSSHSSSTNQNFRSGTY